MNELKLSQTTLDSREVADMIEKLHAHLLRDIETYIGYLSLAKVENPKLDSQDFFIESCYKVEGNNKDYKCFKITKKGCEFIAHKLTGQKGAIFTASYIDKFHEMERALHQPKALSPMEQLRLQYHVIEDHDERITHLENNMVIDHGQEVSLKKEIDTQVKISCGCTQISGRELPSAYLDKKLRSRVYRAIWRDFKDYFNITSYHNTLKKDFEAALKFITAWKPTGSLLREIQLSNHQINI